MTLLMILADVAVAILRPELTRQWPVFVIMPGTLALILLVFTISLRWARGRGKPRANDVASRFMGRTLVLAGGLMTLAHAAMLAHMTGWSDSPSQGMIIRLFMAGMGVIVVLMNNQMPKLFSPMPRNRLWSGWIGVVGGLAMILISLTLPLRPLTTGLYMGLVIFIPLITASISAGTRARV
jgi:hypothetical protein